MTPEMDESLPPLSTVEPDKFAAAVEIARAANALRREVGDCHVHFVVCQATGMLKIDVW